MKVVFEKMNEAVVAAFVVAALIVAAVLMFGFAVWESIAGKKRPVLNHSKPEQLFTAAMAGETAVPVPDRDGGVPQ